jgi:capsular exopolysaccharide synthesis family protein
VYQSNVQIFVATTSSTPDTNVQYQAAAFTQTQVQTFAKIVASPDVLDQVKSDLNLTDAQVDDVKDNISADAPAGQSIVNLHVTDGSADRAQTIAVSVSKAFVKTVEGYYADSSHPSIPTPVRLFVTSPASHPGSPSSPKPFLDIALGLLLGLLVGIGVAVGRDILDNRVKSVEDLGKAAAAPVMGIVVDDPSASRHPIATRAGTRNQRAENFRQLRANLQFANVDEHPRIIAITSSIPSEGKTMVAMNLASTLAEAGFTVCLVDADLRRPTIAKSMGLPSSVGLTSVLINQIDLIEALQSAGTNLYVLSSGPTPPNPSEVLASSYVRDVVRGLLDKVDYVILDTAPLLPVADGSEVAALADGTLLVARHKVTTDPQVKRAAASLARVDAKLVGVVLNRVPGKRNSDYAYTYYRAEPEPSPNGRAHRTPDPVKR